MRRHVGKFEQRVCCLRRKLETSRFRSSFLANLAATTDAAANSQYGKSSSSLTAMVVGLFRPLLALLPCLRQRVYFSSLPPP